MHTLMIFEKHCIPVITHNYTMMAKPIKTLKLHYLAMIQWCSLPPQKLVFCVPVD